MDHFCYLCFVFVMFSCLFIVVMWLPAVERVDLLALLYVMLHCTFVTFQCGVLGQVWCLIVSIPDLCRLSYFDSENKTRFKKAQACMMSTGFVFLFFFPELHGSPLH